MGRVEEAINVVHLLADQPPIDNDRRRVFPLVVCNIKILKINNISKVYLVRIYSKSSRKIK
jgi:hypothetical protein